jgi:hypothetical protein
MRLEHVRQRRRGLQLLRGHHRRAQSRHARAADVGQRHAVDTGGGGRGLSCRSPLGALLCSALSAVSCTYYADCLCLSAPPPLQYEDESAPCMDTSVRMKMDFDNLQLEYVAYKYTLNGTFLGSEDVSVCLSVCRLRVSVCFSRACVCLWRENADALFELSTTSHCSACLTA